MVGAIHGRLLTAWSTAGIIGPTVIAWMREYQLGLGIPREQVYNQTMFILVGMLVIGLICNLMIRPVADKWFMTPAELADERSRALAQRRHRGRAHAGDAPTPALYVALAWLAVGIPLAWGTYRTLLTIGKLFA